MTYATRAGKSQATTAGRQVLFENLYTTNSAFTVALTITPATNVSVYAVEEQVLPGLTFANFSTSGVFDAINRKITRFWIFFRPAASTALNSLPHCSLQILSIRLAPLGQRTVANSLEHRKELNLSSAVG